MCKLFFILLVTLVFININHAEEEYLLVDDMNKFHNCLKGRTDIYMSNPSKILFVKPFKMKRNNKIDNVLKIKWIKMNKGGKKGKGGWCGYYSVFKIREKYLDLTDYKRLTFWIKGEKGGENFVIGLTDKKREKKDNSTKSLSITRYLPEGKITTAWQKAVVPLKSFKINYEQVYSLNVCFESFLYNNKINKGAIYIDDMKFEK